MRVLIAGGGTGGHLFSGIAVADELSADGGHEIIFVGTSRGLESRLIPELGYKLRCISIGGLKRMGPWRTLINMLKLPLSLLQSFLIVLRFRPHVALGVGGYASGPVMLAARLLFRPTVIIEQNSYPGITNRILGKIVRIVVTQFTHAAEFFPAAKIRRLGNPVRPEIVEKAREDIGNSSDGPCIRLLITGGSQGAHAINMTVVRTLEKLENPGKDIVIRHQTGAADEVQVREIYAKAGIKAEVTAFIDDMITAYLEADLVICRAGAGTISELGIVGKPALFVPLPTAADDHQTLNARELVDADAAWLVKQSDFNEEYLADFIRNIVRKPEELERRRLAAISQGRPEAARDVADLLYQEAGLRKKQTA